MLSLEIFPSNKKQFIRLSEFLKEILKICDEQKIRPIIYGSLAVLAYTKNKNMKVNDIDMLVKEKDLAKIMNILEKRKIEHKYDKRWHVLQIFKSNAKIEMDSIESWQKDLPQDFQELNFGGLNVRVLGLKTLKNVYKKASETSEDNPEGNRKKFNELDKIVS